MISADLYVAFGRKLASARKRASLTQSEVAQSVGLSRASIANIEAGKQRVFLDQIFDLASALSAKNLTELLPEYLIDNSNDRASLILTGAKNLTRDQERVLEDILKSAVKSQ
ncbi:MAG: helix-turn-helix transcriptional regulator [Sphingomonadaceae bacterium]